MDNLFKEFIEDVCIENCYDIINKDENIKVIVVNCYGDGEYSFYVIPEVHTLNDFYKYMLSYIYKIFKESPVSNQRKTLIKWKESIDDMFIFDKDTKIYMYNNITQLLNTKDKSLEALRNLMIDLVKENMK